MTNNPVEIIKKDHKKVEKLFQEYEGLGDNALATKRKIVDQIITELTLHADMEETICYPRFKEILDKEDDKMVEQAYIEHAGAKQLLADLADMDPDQEEFDATVKVLMEQIRHHVKEEENDLLPRVKKEIADVDLELMGEEMMTFKEAHGAEID